MSLRKRLTTILNDCCKFSLERNTNENIFGETEISGKAIMTCLRFEERINRIAKLNGITKPIYSKLIPKGESYDMGYFRRNEQKAYRSNKKYF